QLIEYRRHVEQMVTRVAQTTVPNQYGLWRAIGYLNSMDGTEHLALVLGDLDASETAPNPPAVLVRGDDPPSPPAALVRGDDPPSPSAALFRGDDPPSP